jgi:hypothetical protein
MMASLVAAWLVLWLPGAWMFRLPGQSRDYRAALPADERVFWTLVLSAVWSVGVVLLLGMFDLYRFDRLLVVNAVAAGLAILLFRKRLRYDATVGGWPKSACVPAATIALGLWLYFPSAEYVIGGKDPGTYINEGVQLAQRGQVIVTDEVVGSVPEPFRDLFFPPHNLGTYYGLRFMGFFIQDPTNGQVVGQFPHLFPASVAIGYGLDGLTGARHAIGVWAILGLLAVYYAGAELFGRAVAGAATLLLSINVVVVWFARYPNSELPMQALLFAALLAAARTRSGGGRFFGIVAGALLGLTLFLRYEILLAFVAVASVAVLSPITRERFGWTFTAALALTSTAGLWYLLDPMRAYSAYPLGFLQNRGGWWLGGLGLLGAVAVNRLVRIERVGHAVRRVLPASAAVVVVALAVYAYFFRDVGGRLALGDAMAFRTFGWYLTPPVLAAAVIGTSVLVWRRFWRSPLFFATFLIFCVFFFYKTRIVPEHFWTARRFLSVALPGALLVAVALIKEGASADLLGRLAGSGRRLTPRAANIVQRTLIVALSAPAALAFWTASAPVRRHVEYAGLIPKLEALAGRIGARDLVIVESRNAGSDLHVLAMPLGYIYARAVLVLDSPVPDKRLFDTFVAWARTRYEHVWFLGGGGTSLLSRQVSAEAHGGERFQVPEYDTPINRYPTGVHQKEFEYGLYRLTTATAVAPGPVDLTIGSLDDLNVVRFHARETRGDSGVAFRWTRGLSRILLQGFAPETETVTLWLSSGGRPPSAARPLVEVSLGGQPLGSIEPRDAMEAFSLTVPRALSRELAASGDPAELLLRVPTWTPSREVGGNDTRELGVIVFRVQTR